MDQLKVTGNSVATDTEMESSPYVPSLQLTEGQPPPIAANGGLSFMSFERDGDGGTAEAIAAALALFAGGEGQRVIDMLENAPPGPIETKWGVGFREYAECMDHIRENDIEAPEGGVALPLRYTVYDHPNYSIVPSNTLWRDPARAAEAEVLQKAEQDNTRRAIYFPHVLRDARRIEEYHPGLSPNSPECMDRLGDHRAGALRVQVRELLRRGRGGGRVLPGDGEAPLGVFPGRDGRTRVQPRRI